MHFDLQESYIIPQASLVQVGLLRRIRISQQCQSTQQSALHNMFQAIHTRLFCALIYVTLLLLGITLINLPISYNYSTSSQSYDRPSVIGNPELYEWYCSSPNKAEQIANERWVKYLKYHAAQTGMHSISNTVMLYIMHVMNTNKVLAIVQKYFSWMNMLWKIKIL